MCSTTSILLAQPLAQPSLCSFFEMNGDVCFAYVAFIVFIAHMLVIKNTKNCS